VIGSPCKPGANPGGKELWPCHPLCVEKAWEWRFWVTNYNVGSTWGQGEHQGIGIFGFEYAFDRRIPPERGTVQPPWNAPNSIMSVVSRPDEHGEAGIVLRSGLCENPLPPRHHQFIFNHGRTLARHPSSAQGDDQKDPRIAGRYPVEARARISIPPVPHSEWALATPAGGESKTLDRVKNTQACLDKIEDGFCDAVCGNCSYVLPRGMGIGVDIGPGKAMDQGMQFSRQEGTEPLDVHYLRTTEEENGRRVRIPGAQPPPRRDERSPGWDPPPEQPHPEEEGFRDPFTHCVDPRNPVQALSNHLVFLTPDGSAKGRVVTGLWGHNSNTDAEVEYEVFVYCGTTPENLARIPEACKECGKWRPGSDEQWPCLDHTNRAKSKWDRFPDVQDVDDSSLGMVDPERDLNPVPLCKGNKNRPVHGM
jgi:hypothetical protein